MTTEQAITIISKLDEITSQSAINIEKMSNIISSLEMIISILVIIGFTMLLFKYILNIRIL